MIGQWTTRLLVARYGQTMLAEVRAADPKVADCPVMLSASSPNTCGAAFAATHPALAVISCDAVNAFGFPSPDVVERWQAAGTEVARTDRDGAVTVTIDADGKLSIERVVR